ncbi:hypothetical protein UFOVP58_89 [uncultured Caudovirales phage]|uniref:Uncharacterized protein n=1 Tax=uncultured Caudovirales phage TaxID=2100421 RepID=A0A6J5KW11_9CAUD|nr:hypothetical protein UFOVP58_89 [uncultured Caudovirales phage]
MNELIERLAEQCYEHDQSWTGVGQRIFDHKHFAEMIIRECVKHITDQQDIVETDWQCKDGIHIVYSLKEHFGVDE